MSEQKALVMGGAGYIGSHACNEPKHAGLTLVTFDGFVIGLRGTVKFSPFERGDMLNKADVE